MAFLFTWNATFEGQPADTENASLGAGRIRDLKAAISERLEIDHSWAGDASDGLHLQTTMPQHATSPAVAANQGAFYVKDSAGTTVPFFKDDAGNTRELTTGGQGDRGDIIVSGVTWTIDNNVVTYAKMQDMATGKLLGRSTAGSGDIEEITVGAGLTLSAGTITGVPQASTAEVLAESVVTKYISPDRLKNSERVAKAWVNFNGTGAVSIGDSFNVSSITDNGTGDYTINFTAAIGNDTYSVVVCAQRPTAASPVLTGIKGSASTSLLTTSARIDLVTAGGAQIDMLNVCATVFGA